MHLPSLKKWPLIYALLLGHILSIHAQQDFSFQRLSSKNGDFQSIIYNVEQDSFGNIWTATEEGLTRFNGQETFLYNRYQGLPINVSNRAMALLVDGRGRIWLGTEEGLSLYHAAKDVFEFIKIGATKKPNRVRVIEEDKNGDIWLGAFNGLWKYEASSEDSEKAMKQYYDGINVRAIHLSDTEVVVGSVNGVHAIDLQSSDLRPLCFNSDADRLAVSCIYKDDNKFLIGTVNDGLYKTNQRFQNPTKIDLAPFKQRNFLVSKILPDQSGNLFVATDGGGLLYLDGEYNLIRSFTNDVNNPKSISSNGVYDIFLDQENLLWIATYGGGLNRLSLSKHSFQNITHQLNTDNSLVHDFTRSILEDDKGNIWFGTKKGISIWNRKTKQWKNLPALSADNSKEDIILTLEEDGDFIWAGTYGSGAFKINKNDFTFTQYHENKSQPFFIELTKIYSILKDAQSNIWLGGIDKDLIRISPKGAIHTFPISQIRRIIQARDGGIWIVGKTGVQKIKGDEITRYTQFDDIDFTTINCLHEKENGEVTIGTNGVGILFYQSDNESITTYTQKNGLPSDIVQGLLYDAEGNLWVSTTRGLASLTMSASDTIVKVFNKADGLINNEYNYGSFAKTKSGELFFGGIDGVTFFTPSLIAEQQNVPRIVFEEFDLFQKKEEGKEVEKLENINLKKEIKLHHTENSLRIKFVGILHSAPEKVNYSWKMEGATNQWSEPGPENNINFSNLSPGNYVFKVKAANRDGIWSPERQLKINIAAPWWATKLAYFIYGLMAIAALYGIFYLIRVFSNKKNAEEQIAFFSNITHELKTPLSILLSTLESVPEGEANSKEANKKVKTTITRLNTLFDQLLNFNKVTSGKYQKQIISKIDLESHIQHSIYSFQPLMEKRNIKVDIQNTWSEGVFYYDKESLNKVVFNLLSNAIKYSKDNSNINIVLAEGKPGFLKLSVKDEGIGIPKDQQKQILKRYYRGRNAINSQLPGTGLGLMIVKNLVERDNGTIDFNSIENEGTTFNVQIKNHKDNYSESAILPQQTKEGSFVPDQSKIDAFSDAKILIVEDNDELRKILVDKISTYFQVLEASNGKEGLETVKEQFPDLIITDLIMPEMDGMTMCKALQADLTTNHIPLFMMTVLNSTQNKIESVESGIVAYMEKPLDFDFLMAKIVSTLSRQKRLSEKYLHQVEIESAEKFRNKRDGDFINTLEKFVLEQIQLEGLSVHDLCRHVGMSRTALYMKLKNMIDMSPQNFIIHTRLKFARKLLLERENNIKEVAYLAGFANPKYFSTSFKKQFGQSPTEFLKSVES